MQHFGILLATLISCSANSVKPTPLFSSEDRPVETRLFAVAGGKTVAVPVAELAENDIFIIRSAGFTIEPSHGNPKQPVLTWKFSIQSKSSNAIEGIVVEEVAPSKTEISYITQQQPVFKDNVWMGTCEPLPMAQTSLPWLNSAEESVFVFKFTVKAQGHEPSILYQARWYSPSLKWLYLSKADQIRSVK